MTGEKYPLGFVADEQEAYHGTKLCGIIEKIKSFLREDMEVKFRLAIVFLLVISAIKGMSYDGKTQSRNRSGENVAFALDNLASGRLKDALADIEAVVSDDSEPESIKRLFRSFLPSLEFFVKGESSVDKYDLHQSRNARIFINDASVIQQYFSKEKKEKGLARAAVIPYWLIKTFYAEDRHQKDNLFVYDDYIRHFISGKMIDVQGANVICLYVYAKYDAASTAREYEVLNEEITNFLKVYAPLREKGDMKIQRTYLLNAQEVLKNNPNGNAVKKIISSKNKLKPYPL